MKLDKNYLELQAASRGQHIVRAAIGTLLEHEWSWSYCQSCGIRFANGNHKDDCHFVAIVHWLATTALDGDFSRDPTQNLWIESDKED